MEFDSLENEQDIPTWSNNVEKTRVVHCGAPIFDSHKQQAATWTTEAASKYSTSPKSDKHTSSFSSSSSSSTTIST